MLLKKLIQDLKEEGDFVYLSMKKYNELYYDLLIPSQLLLLWSWRQMVGDVNIEHFLLLPFNTINAV